MVANHLITGPRSLLCRFTLLCWIGIALIPAEKYVMADVSYTCATYNQSMIDNALNEMQRTFNLIDERLPKLVLQTNYRDWVFYDFHYYGIPDKTVSYTKALQICQEAKATVFSFTQNSLTALLQAVEKHNQPPVTLAGKSIWLGLVASTLLSKLVSYTDHAILPDKFDTDTKGGRAYVVPATVDATKCYALTIGSTFPELTTVTYTITAQGCETELVVLCTAPVRQDYAPFYNKRATILELIKSLRISLQEILAMPIAPANPAFSTVDFCPIQATDSLPSLHYPLQLLHERLQDPNSDPIMLLELIMLYFDDASTILGFMQTWKNHLYANDRNLYCICSPMLFDHTSMALPPVLNNQIGVSFLLVGAFAGLLTFATSVLYLIYRWTKFCCARCPLSPAQLTTVRRPLRNDRRVSFHDDRSPDYDEPFLRSDFPRATISSASRRSNPSRRQRAQTTLPIAPRHAPFVASLPPCIIRPLTPVETNALAILHPDPVTGFVPAPIPDDLRSTTPPSSRRLRRLPYLS